jgi:hypothetical protein
VLSSTLARHTGITSTPPRRWRARERRPPAGPRLGALIGSPRGDRARPGNDTGRAAETGGWFLGRGRPPLPRRRPQMRKRSPGDPWRTILASAICNRPQGTRRWQKAGLRNSGKTNSRVEVGQIGVVRDPQSGPHHARMCLPLRSWLSLVPGQTNPDIQPPNKSTSFCQRTPGNNGANRTFDLAGSIAPIGAPLQLGRRNFRFPGTLAICSFGKVFSIISHKPNGSIIVDARRLFQQQRVSLDEICFSLASTR